MAVNTNKSCDNCATILYGSDRGNFVQKPNIFINGQVGKNHVDPESGWRETKYLTRSANEQLCFCDTACLVEWAAMQEELWDNRKKARLMAEAGQDQMIRLERDFKKEKRDTPHRGAPPPANAPGS